MAGATSSNDDEAIAGINVTPFVDIALVLLVVFMVTAKYIVSQSIPVDLPTASSSSSTPLTGTVAVSVERSGQIHVDTRTVTSIALLDEMRQRFATAPETRVVINADRNATHGQVTDVVDIVRQAGFVHFAFQTTVPDTQGQK